MFAYRADGYPPAVLRIFASLPLRGPAGGAGQDIPRGADPGRGRPARGDAVGDYSGLGGPTLVRLMPDDRPLARGIPDPGQGRRHPARPRRPRPRPRPRPRRPGREDARPGPAGDRSRRARPSGLGSRRGDGGRLRRHGRGAAARTRLFTVQRGPRGFYGYETAALILDAVAAAGGDRPAVTETARRARDRDSALGRYSVDEDGLTTAPADGRLAVVDGEVVWDRAP
jgi:hypothetical protein